jgi:transcription elongation factor GreA
MEVGQEITYVLVDPTEMDLRSGKISVESPAGKAFLDRAPGDTVEVQAPVGLIHYRIERVES